MNVDAQTIRSGLTPAQASALKLIHEYRTHRVTGAWRGNGRQIKLNTISEIRSLGLIVERNAGFSVTLLLTEKGREVYDLLKTRAGKQKPLKA